jgi:hypothetical protein
MEVAEGPGPFAYGFISGGRRGRLLFEELHSALYTALLDLHEQRREPLGIRQGARLLYRREGLERLHAEHRAGLAAGEHYAVIQRLAQQATRQRQHRRTGGSDLREVMGGTAYILT